MKRVIKFRGKSLKDGNWLYGDIVRTVDGSFAVVPAYVKGKPVNHNLYEVDEQTVDQFTGLKDRNGTEIYEGDIVKSDRNTRHLVKFSDKDGCYHAQLLPESKYRELGGAIYQKWIDDFGKIVIDNIYDNPQLLEQ